MFVVNNNGGNMHFTQILFLRTSFWGWPRESSRFSFFFSY